MERLSRELTTKGDKLEWLSNELKIKEETFGPTHIEVSVHGFNVYLRRAPQYAGVNGRRIEHPTALAGTPSVL